MSIQVEVKAVVFGGQEPTRKWRKGYEWLYSTDRWGKPVAMVKVLGGLFKGEIVSYALENVRPIV